MKRIIITLFCFFLLINKSVFATDESTGSAAISPTSEKSNQIIKAVEKIVQSANKEMMVYHGVITKVDEENFQIKSNNKDLTIQTDSKTSFYWINSDKKILNLTFKDFVKEDTITAWGNVNSESEVMMAKAISGRISPVFISCKVSKINETDNTIICKDNSKSHLLSIDSKTIISSWQSKKLSTIKSVNLKVNQHLLIRGMQKSEKSDLINCLTVTIIP